MCSPRGSSSSKSELRGRPNVMVKRRTTRVWEPRLAASRTMAGRDAPDQVLSKPKSSRPGARRHRHSAPATEPQFVRKWMLGRSPKSDGLFPRGSWVWSAVSERRGPAPHSRETALPPALRPNFAGQCVEGDTSVPGTSSYRSKIGPVPAPGAAPRVRERRGPVTLVGRRPTASG